MNRVLRRAATLAVGTVLLTGPVVTSAAAAPARVGLQAALDGAVAVGAPGALAGVLDEGGQWYGHSGVGNLADRGTPKPRGQFRAGSITKTVVATAVLQLVGEGRVELEDRIQDRLPGLLPYAEPITVRQLLQHTSGIPFTERWAGLPEIDTTRWQHQPPDETIRKGAEGKPLSFPPGQGVEYSNTNYAVLGKLVEKLTGRSLHAELQRRVLDRAGMRDSYLPYRHPHVDRPAARGYERLHGPDAAPTDVTDYEMSRFWGSGNLVSTVDDLNRFYRALLAGGLVPAAQAAEMRTTVPSGIPGLEFGLGLMRIPLPPGCAAPDIWGFNGSVPGYHTWTMHSPDARRQVSVVVTANLTSVAAQDAALQAVFAEFCGAGQQVTSRAGAVASR
ncbi:serine hydrolase domain-containing protein [Saccharothrix luteola]|uniref:serine hydrolase domain-containing protein n=1 Tax=Saccharothrix luteola TaxID=2893018 RepID=UPI001E59BE67|nr:serine hydrolase domain-containing protein [Saccharothrix luteola]MCC8246345.1 beta-lactamase family protein [Saccharothrix luteola]